MMWRLHLECFKIARGRPVSIPGSRLLAAAFLSRAGSSGRKRTIDVSDSAWGRKMEPPWKRRKQSESGDQAAPDRFPDLPPEPAGFGDWAAFRAGVDAQRTNPTSAEAGRSPLEDGAPVPTGSAVRIRSVRYPEGGHRPAPVGEQAGPSPDSPLADAGPGPVQGEVPLSERRDGQLLRVRPPEEPPVVRVRTDQVVPLAERRTEAVDANREREADAAAAAVKASAEERRRQEQAALEQAELRARAKAAMARMAGANGGAAVHEVPPARKEHAFPPPKPAPRPEGGAR
ncbi:hypothetical protein AB0A73_24625 [Glycomyces sp. NPDC047369]